MQSLSLYTDPPAAGGTFLQDLAPYVIGDCQPSTNRYGDQTLTVTLDVRLLRDAFALYSTDGLWLVYGQYGLVIFEGRVEDRAIQNGSVRLTAFGAQNALRDLPYSGLWSDTQFTNWTPRTYAENTNYADQKYAFVQGGGSDNYYAIAPRKGEIFGNSGGSVKAGSIQYTIPWRSTKQIIGLDFMWGFGGSVTPTSWTLNAATYTMNWDTGVETLLGVQFSTVYAPGNIVGAVHLTFGTPCDRVAIALYRNAADAAYTGETGPEPNGFSLILRALRVVTATTYAVSTTITSLVSPGTAVTYTVGSTANMYAGQVLLIGTSTSGVTSSPVRVISVTDATHFVADAAVTYTVTTPVSAHQVRADDIVRGLLTDVRATNPDQLSAATALIGAPGLDLLNARYEDQYAADILDGLAALGDTAGNVWQWKIEPGRVLRFDTLSSGGRVWYVDVTALELEGSITNLANSVYAVYQDIYDNTRRSATATDVISVARAGFTRRQAITADTTNPTVAGLIRDTALADGKNAPPRVGLTFTELYDAAGARYPVWMVRAGDTLVMRNLSASVSPTVDQIRSFVVDTTKYNPLTRAIDVAPATPLPRLDVLLARRQEGIR